MYNVGIKKRIDTNGCLINLEEKENYKLNL